MSDNQDNPQAGDNEGDNSSNDNKGLNLGTIIAISIISAVFIAVGCGVIYIMFFDKYAKSQRISGNRTQTQGGLIRGSSSIFEEHDPNPENSVSDTDSDTETYSGSDTVTYSGSEE